MTTTTMTLTEAETALWESPYCDGGVFRRATRDAILRRALQAGAPAYEIYSHDGITLDAGEHVACVRSMADLLDAIHAGHPIDMSDLPTFGGSEPPSGTAGVWSWDEDSLLVTDRSGTLSIVPRAEWPED